LEAELDGPNDSGLADQLDRPHPVARKRKRILKKSARLVDVVWWGSGGKAKHIRISSICEDIFCVGDTHWSQKKSLRCQRRQFVLGW
jgi:hypothetical protein